MTLCGKRKRDNDEDGFDGCGPTEKDRLDSRASALHMNRGWERFES